MLMTLGGLCLGVVLLVVIALVVADSRAKKRAAEALAARGKELGQWTVYYDVKQHRIGLIGTFPEEALLRYMLFRAHDLIDYHRGVEGERRRIGEALISAARNLEGQKWELLYPAPKSECFHGTDSPNGTLFKYFDGKLYENAIDQPRFLGGDSIAKHEGLLGECIALIQHFAKDPSRGAIISAAVVRMVEKELREGQAGSGAMFWNLPNETRREIAGPQA